MEPITEAQNSRAVYLLPGTGTRRPFASFDRAEIEKFAAYEARRSEGIVSLVARGEFPDYNGSIFAGLLQMAYDLTEDAEELGVELQLHIGYSSESYGPAIFITEGRSELLRAIKDAYDQGPTYATGILGRESINFGSMLDLEIAIRHSLKNIREAEDNAFRMSDAAALDSTAPSDEPIKSLTELITHAADLKASDIHLESRGTAQLTIGKEFHRVATARSAAKLLEDLRDSMGYLELLNYHKGAPVDLQGAVFGPRGTVRYIAALFPSERGLSASIRLVPVLSVDPSEVGAPATKERP